MELVYLWVKKYKNIENQGFNFSPRFKCEFKPEYEDYECCEDKKIKQKINKNSINNLFYERTTNTIVTPSNINITTIAGENGSGKTSILHELFYIKNNEFIRSAKPSETLLWIYNEVKNEPEYIGFEDFRSKVQIIYSDNDCEAKSYNNGYSINFLTNIEDYKKRNNAVLAYLGLNKFKEPFNCLFFLPTHFEFKLITIIGLSFESLLNKPISRFNKFNEEKKSTNINSDTIRQLNHFLNKNISKKIQTFQETLDITEYIYLRSFIYNLSKGNENSFKIFEKLFFTGFDINFPFIELIKKELYKNKEDKTIFNKTIINLNQLFENKRLVDNKFIFEISANINQINELILNAEMNVFEINVVSFKDDQNIYFKELSSGEQKLILLFAKLNYIISKYNDIQNKENFLLLLDEPDMWLHPNWQKKFISYLINFIENNQYLKEKKFHIIITSHSPFILSDIPKENVMFLKEGKQIDVDIDTFGANIHTLLSHGFFMENGLMGEFAKSKIEEIKKFYELIKKLEERINKKEKTKILAKKSFERRKEKFYNIQKIIGEPFLKTIMGNYLDELEQVFDAENYKLKQKEKLLNQFTKEELSKYLDEISD